MNDSIIIKQIWDGTVIEYENKVLTIKLEDLTNPDYPDELITISINDIDKNEHQMLQVGASLIWVMGSKLDVDNSQHFFSKITFQKLPKWSKKEICNAELLAQEYSNFFINTKNIEISDKQ